MVSRAGQSRPELLNPKMKTKPQAAAAQTRKWRTTLWPQVPLSLILVFVGMLNIIDGLRLPLSVLPRIHALDGLGESFSALGGTAQVLLGTMMAMVGVALLWRLAAAWTFSVLLLLIMVGLDVGRSHWGVSLLLQALLLGGLLWGRPYFTRRTMLAGLMFSPVAVGGRLLADLVEGASIPKQFQDLLEGHLPGRESA